MRGPLSALVSMPAQASSAYDWLLVCYCSGLEKLALPHGSSASQVAALLESRSYSQLAQLLTGSLPDGVGLVLAMDIRLGDAPSLCIVRTELTQMREWPTPLEFSVSLTQLLSAAAHWIPAARNALFLLPQEQSVGSMVPLFPSTPGILAGLPQPKNQPQLGTASGESQQASLLNAVEVGLALADSRHEGGPRLHLLLSENCLQPSLETAYQLHEEVEYFAPLRCRGSNYILGALTSLLREEQSLQANPDRLLLEILNAADGVTRAPQTALPWQGLIMGRIAHLYFLCAQFASNSQALWQEDRSIQTAYLLSSFRAGAEGVDYRELFALAQGLRFELHRLPFAAVEHIDPVLLSQLSDNLMELLKVKRNQPPMFLLPGDAGAQPHLQVYLPTGSPLPEFQLLHFAQGGWANFIQLLHAARA